MSSDAARLQAFSDAAQEQSTIRVPVGAAEEVAPPEPERSDSQAPPLAGILRARLERISQQRTRDFPLPGWKEDLVIRARFMDRPEWQGFVNDGPTDEALILAATEALLLRDPQSGELVEIPGGFGPALAAELGMPSDTPPSRLVAAVLDDRGPWITSLARDLMSWLMGRGTTIAEHLGE